MESKLKTHLWEILNSHLTATESEWLLSKLESKPLDQMTAFVAAPRFLSKKIVEPTAVQLADLQLSLPGFNVSGWSLVRLARVWIAGNFKAETPEEYVKNIETLFNTAEMNELVALYSALPVLEYPEKWIGRATDAVRSNMGIVFDAIAMNNPFPSMHFSELAWNQLVMKTIFNDKPIHMIYGLEAHANADLALIVSDFAHERWAAGRQIAPEIWRLVTNFLSDRHIEDLKTLLSSSKPYQPEAGALVCFLSKNEEALQLLKEYPELERRVSSGELTWSHLEFKELNTYVS